MKGPVSSQTVPEESPSVWAFPTCPAASRPGLFHCTHLSLADSRHADHGTRERSSRLSDKVPVLMRPALGPFIAHGPEVIIVLAVGLLIALTTSPLGIAGSGGAG